MASHTQSILKNSIRQEEPGNGTGCKGSDTTGQLTNYLFSIAGIMGLIESVVLLEKTFKVCALLLKSTVYQKRKSTSLPKQRLHSLPTPTQSLKSHMK